MRADDDKQHFNLQWPYLMPLVEFYSQKLPCLASHEETQIV